MISENNLLSHNGIVIWLLGLSGSGKSTIANLLKEKLSTQGYASVILDGDNLRTGISHNLSFSDDDRSENIRRAAEIAKILHQNNIITICSLITPLGKHRDLAHSIIGDPYFEVFVDCPLEVCEKRDVKGLYKKARTKNLSDFTGISSRFEAPLFSHLTLLTNTQAPEESCELLYSAISPILVPNNLINNT
jgi:adenylylsulfate kinase